MRLDLGHRPETPLKSARASVDGRRPEPILTVLFREVEIDRHRFPQNRSVVVEHRDVSVGIHLHMFGRTRSAVEADGNVLILEAQFFQRPQAPRRSRLRGSIKFDHGKFLQFYRRSVSSSSGFDCSATKIFITRTASLTTETLNSSTRIRFD